MKKILFILLCSSIVSISLANDIDDSSSVSLTGPSSVENEGSAAVETTDIKPNGISNGTNVKPYLLLHGEPRGYTSADVFQFLNDVIEKLPLETILGSLGI